MPPDDHLKPEVIAAFIASFATCDRCATALLLALQRARPSLRRQGLRGAGTDSAVNGARCAASQRMDGFALLRPLFLCLNAPLFGNVIG